jgi:hypothetical protein
MPKTGFWDILRLPVNFAGDEKDNKSCQQGKLETGVGGRNVRKT